MKTEQEYIITFIDKSAEKFPLTIYKYEWKEETNTHLIEVTPSDFAVNDEQFAVDQFEFVNTFIKKFPYSSIYFISQDDLIKLTNPIYQTSESVFEDEKIAYDLVAYFEYTKNTLDTYTFVEFPKIEAMVDSLTTSDNPLLEEALLVKTKFKRNKSQQLAGELEPLTKASKITAGESNYAMAA